MTDEDTKAFIQRALEALPPLEDSLAKLGTAKSCPDLEIGHCLLAFDQAAPHLRKMVEQAIDEESPSEEVAQAAFVAIHILGGGRDPQAWPLVMRLLRLPEARLEGLLGDAATETMPRILVGLFNGDVRSLFDFVRDRDVPQFVRGTALQSLAFLTWEGRVPLDHTRAMLLQMDEEKVAADREIGVWHGWGMAIGLLGLRDLLPRMERADQERRLEHEEYLIYVDHLKRAEKDFADPQRFTDEGLGYIEDVVKEVEWFNFNRKDYDWEPGELPDDYFPDFVTTQEPVYNPYRHIGRNDPCPCGSGKKFKKCCLGRRVEKRA